MNEGPSPPRADRCPHCASILTLPASETCPICGRAVATVATERPPDNPYRAPEGLPVGPTVGIGTMMLAIALVAVVLAAWVTAPLLGGVVTAMVLPAVGRTIVIASRSATRLGPWALCDAFFRSFVVSALTILACAIAFFATCLPIGLSLFSLNANGVLIGVGCGLLAAGAVAYYLGRALFRVQSEKESS